MKRKILLYLFAYSNELQNKRACTIFYSFWKIRFKQNSWKHLEKIKIIHIIYFWKMYMYVRLFGRILGWLFLVDGQISADWPPQISSNFLQLKKARGEGLSYKIGSNKNNFRGTVKSRSKLPFGKNWFMRLIKEPSLLLICKRSHWNYFFFLLWIFKGHCAIFQKFQRLNLTDTYPSLLKQDFCFFHPL